ncbi:hypothetical protein V2G26_009515 [Clonostachys chloroleuca]
MVSQAVTAPLTRAATFLIVSAVSQPTAIPTIRATLSSISDITKNISIRHPDGRLSCTVGIGSSIWSRLTSLPQPKELHPFQEIRGAKHTAVSTPGDILFHIRADRRDLCFEFERQLMQRLGSAVTVDDETDGFRYFDARDLLGFVDGTANPVGDEATEAAFVTQEDEPDSAGGSYVVVQKYLHDMEGWQALRTETQEAIIGRTKLDNIELDDAPPQSQQSHKSLATIEIEDDEHAIVRDNMPFGSPGKSEFGTYFIGYSKNLWVTEKMLQRMFVGEPPGMHDRILDYSKAVLGATFFVPSDLASI